MAKPPKLRWNVGDWGDYEHGLMIGSETRLRAMCPHLFGISGTLSHWFHQITGRFSPRDIVREHLWLGSIHPALVMSTDPLRIAAYSSDLDCVTILAFDADLVQEFALKRQSRLLSLNYYATGPKHADLVFGPGKCTDWTGMHPVIANFLTDDRKRLAEQTAAIDPTLWRRAWELGQEYVAEAPDLFREGIPYAQVQGNLKAARRRSTR